MQTWPGRKRNRSGPFRLQQRSARTRGPCEAPGRPEKTHGADKTTIRILLGLLRKDGGEVSLLGREPWRDAVELHLRLAYVPCDVTLWPSLTSGEIIDLLGSLRGGVDTGRRQALTERFDLDTAKKARAYSRGNRQKVR
jgi:ABC-2 type transport system ATP-binding protein